MIILLILKNDLFIKKNVKNNAVLLNVENVNNINKNNIYNYEKCFITLVNKIIFIYPENELNLSLYLNFLINSFSNITIVYKNNKQFTNNILDSSFIDKNNNINYYYTFLEIRKNNISNKNCNTSFYISKKALDFMKNLCLHGGFTDKTQKEIGGSLILDKNNKLITSDLTIGQEQGVNIPNSIFNYHSHPKEAYHAHNTKNGFPSCQDYIGFLKMHSDGTICHFVSAIEGLYIISINKDYIDKTDKIDISIIKKNYHFKYKNIKSPEHYIDNINLINPKYFDILFYKWDNLNEKVKFNINFSKCEKNCFTNNELLNLIKKINYYI